MMSFGKDKMLPLKALMALLIVADHLTFHIDSVWLLPVREIGAPIVSVFLFISGYGLYQSYRRRGAGYLDGFFKKRIGRVVLPALLALAAYYLVNWNPDRNYLLELEQAVTQGIPLLPYSWFVVDIVLFYLLFYLAFRFLPERWRLGALAIGTCLLMALVILAGYDRCWWIGSLAFPTGAFFARYEPRVYAFCEKDKRNYWGLLLLLFLVFGALYLTRNPYVWCLCYVVIPVIAALVVARLPLGKMNGPVVTFIGTISYEIYLCQGISMDFFESKVPVGSPALYALLVYVSCIALATLIHFLCKMVYHPKP